MEKDLTSKDRLTQKIKALELQEASQMLALKNQVNNLKHSMAPSALISATFKGITGNNKVQGNIIDSTAGIAVGWVVRKLFAKTSGGILTKLSGYALQYLTTKIITKKMPVIREKIHEQGLIK